MGVRTLDYFYFGPDATEGSLRMSKNAGGQLLVERYQGGTWVELSVIGSAYFDPDDYHNYVKTTVPAIEAYWRLNEASGTTAGDDTGDGNTGSYVNVPNFQAVAGPTVTSDEAIELVSGDRVDANFTPSTDAEHTHIFWYKPSDPGFWTGTSYKCFLYMSGASGSYGMFKKNVANELYLWGSSTGDATITVPSGVDDWSLYALRYSVAQAKYELWINGSVRGAAGTPSTIGAVSANYPRIGNNDVNSQHCDGYYSQYMFVPEYVSNADLDLIYNPS